MIAAKASDIDFKKDDSSYYFSLKNKHLQQSKELTEPIGDYTLGY